VELAAEDGEHVHSGVRLLLEQSHNVIAVNFNADGFLSGDGVGLMRSLFEHGCETEKFSVLGLIDYNFLMIFVNDGDLYVARDHDVSVSAGIANFVDALARGEFSKLDLRGEDGALVIVEESEERDGFQVIGVAGHVAPRFYL
jgi:hypothetical protein